MSDSEIDFLSSESPRIELDNTIDTIYSIIKAYISLDERLETIKLKIDVIEIKNYKGMAFLKIKDSTATMQAVIYKSNYANDIMPNDCLNIVGRLDLYRGQIQLIIKSYQKLTTIVDNQFTLLKNKLGKLGYFDNKPILENNYNNIGIISSINAAGLKDFLHTINERSGGKKLYIYPSSVQGTSASKEICAAIRLANKHQASEILVLIRGGGSKDDLECFNSEEVAHAIHKSTIPIVTGIGHQIDTCIADLVCAKSFITPTAVAQNITMETINSKKILDKLMGTIRLKIIQYMDNLCTYIKEKDSKLSKYYNRIIISFDDNLFAHNTNQNLLMNKIIQKMNNKHDYFIKCKSDLQGIMDIYADNIAAAQKLHQSNLINGITKCEQIIKVYDSECKILSKPRVFNKNDKEIYLLSELEKGETYKISFIDGILNLNL